MYGRIRGRLVVEKLVAPGSAVSGAGLLRVHRYAVTLSRHLDCLGPHRP